MFVKVTGEPADGQTRRYFLGEAAVTFMVISPKIGADLSLNMNELAK